MLNKELLLLPQSIPLKNGQMLLTIGQQPSDSTCVGYGYDQNLDPIVYYGDLTNKIIRYGNSLVTIDSIHCYPYEQINRLDIMFISSDLVDRDQKYRFKYKQWVFNDSFFIESKLGFVASFTYVPHEMWADMNANIGQTVPVQFELF